MKLRIVPFEPWHLLQIAVQPEQRINDATLRDEANAIELREAGACFTALDGSTPVAVAGIVDRGPGRAVGWAVFSPQAIARFGAIHRAVKRFIESQNLRRLEIHIDPRHSASARWATRLGFKFEGVMRRYSPDGHDFEQWSRIADDFK